MNNIQRLLILSEKYDQNAQFKEADLLTKEAINLMAPVDTAKTKIISPIVEKILAQAPVRNFVKNYIIEMGVPFLIDAVAVTISGGTATVATPAIHSAVTAILNTPLNMLGINKKEFAGVEENTVGDYVSNRTLEYMKETLKEESFPTKVIKSLSNKEDSGNFIKTILDIIKQELEKQNQLIKNLFVKDLNIIDAIKAKLNLPNNTNTKEKKAPEENTQEPKPMAPEVPSEIVK